MGQSTERNPNLSPQPNFATLHTADSDRNADLELPQYPSNDESDAFSLLPLQIITANKPKQPEGAANRNSKFATERHDPRFFRHDPAAFFEPVGLKRDEDGGTKPPNGCTDPQRTVLMVIDKMLDPVPLLPVPAEDVPLQMCYCLETISGESGKTPLSMNQAIVVLNNLDVLNDMTTVKERGQFAEYLLTGVSNMSVDDALTTEKPRCLHRDTWYEFLNLYHSILIDADSAATIHSHLHDILVYSIPHLTVISTGTQELQTRFTSLVWRLLAALKIDPYYTACPKCLSLRCKLSKILLQLRHQYLLDPVLHGCAKEAIFGDRDDAFAKVRFSESGMPESVVIDNKAWGMQDDDWGNEERDEEGEESQEIEVVWVDGEKDFVSCGIIEMDARRSMEHQVEEIGDMEERIQNADELLARVEKFQNDLLGYEPTIEETREAMDGL